MRIALVALAGAALIAGAATSLAQTAQPAATNNATKVYAYKQGTPKQAAPSMSTAAQPQMPFQQPPDIPAYGSHKWWELHARTAGGEGQ
jgi:hypothetical protein